jgi:hypothetical protein
MKQILLRSWQLFLQRGWADVFFLGRMTQACRAHGNGPKSHEAMHAVLRYSLFTCAAGLTFFFFNVG